MCSQLEHRLLYKTKIGLLGKVFPYSVVPNINDEIKSLVPHSLFLSKMYVLLYIDFASAQLSLFLFSSKMLDAELNSCSLTVLVHGAHKYLHTFCASTVKLRRSFLQYLSAVSFLVLGASAKKLSSCPHPWAFFSLFLQNLLNLVMQKGSCSIHLCPLALWLISFLSTVHLISSTGSKPIP